MALVATAAAHSWAIMKKPPKNEIKNKIVKTTGNGSYRVYR